MATASNGRAAEAYITRNHRKSVILGVTPTKQGRVACNATWCEQICNQNVSLHKERQNGYTSGTASNDGSYCCKESGSSKERRSTVSVTHGLWRYESIGTDNGERKTNGQHGGIQSTQHYAPVVVAGSIWTINAPYLEQGRPFFGCPCSVVQ